MKKLLVLMMVISLAMVGFAACGGGDGDSGNACKDAAEAGCNLASSCGFSVPNCVDLVMTEIENYGASDQECSDGLSEVKSATCSDLQQLILLYGSVPAGTAGMVKGN